GLLGQVLRHATHLEHHASGLDHRDPLFYRPLTATLTGLGGLVRDGLGRENAYPYLAAPPQVTCDGTAGRLDLARRNPGDLQGLEAELAEGNGIALLGEPLHAATVRLP